MKILLLGATGRTGKLVLEAAIKKKFSIHIVVRKTETIKPHENLKIFKGSPQNLEILKNAAQECDAIISVLNISRKSDFPWASLRTPKNFLSETVSKLISISEKGKVQRIVVCSAWGVNESKKDIPFWFRLLIDYSNIGIAYKDHERQEVLLSNSDLNWTIVRPTGLTDSKKAQKVKETFANMPKPSLTISRLSVANYIVDALQKEKLFRKTVTISKL
jgi:putative NADH-flavin reductase